MKAGMKVDENEWLYRRSWPNKNYMNPDLTPTSRVFKLRPKDEGKLSVDVKSMTTAAKSLGDPERFYLYELPNKAILQIESAKLDTIHDHLPDGANDAHALIIGMDIDDEITPGLLAKACKRVFI